MNWKGARSEGQEITGNAPYFHLEQLRREKERNRFESKTKPLLPKNNRDIYLSANKIFHIEGDSHLIVIKEKQRTVLMRKKQNKHSLGRPSLICTSLEVN